MNKNNNDKDRELQSQQVSSQEISEEEYTGFIPDEDNDQKKPSVLKKIFKAIGICILLGVYGVLFVRFFFSCDSGIVDDLLKTDEIKTAYEASPETFEVRQYEITDWYASKNAAGDDSNLGGKLLSVSDLYYIPATESLQVTVKFNLDILEDRETEYSAELLPFELYLLEFDEETGKEITDVRYDDIAAVVYDERYSFGYIRICFDGVKLEKEGGFTDINGDPIMRSYGLFMHMYEGDGKYSEDVYEIFSVYTGKKNYKALQYK